MRERVEELTKGMLDEKAAWRIKVQTEIVRGKAWTKR